MDIQEKIATRIKEIRTSQSLTQEALAFRSDVDRTFMNHVENSKRNVTVKSLEKIIVSGLGISVKEFFSDNIFNGKKK